ncbi:MAG: 23S rRNA (uracil(1939)-C(5))-methyltransferase RlmD [Bacteroidetes bacterium]|nr:MAG: 23S rRNA (uracil(1939)-C(5))-methyltransferase RlmD [Bacteroidota bacterium]
MARKRRPLPLIENLEILDAGAEGKAVARTEERVVFVPFAAPGDVVDVQVYKKKRRFYEARITKFHKKSEQRVEPECSHFGLCGGCKWQHLDYKYQLAFKEKQVKDSIERIAKVPYEEFLPIIGADKIYNYRNKLEFTFSDRRWLTDFDPSKEAGGPEDTNGLGFHLPGMFDKILDIEKCYLQQEPSNAIRLAVKEYALKQGLTFYNVRRWEGFLRNLIIRTTSTGDLMVIVVFRNDDMDVADLMQFLGDRFPEITSLMYVINEKRNDTITDREVHLFKGNPFIMEEMPSPLPGQKPLKFKVGPLSFFQTNPEQAFELYKTAFDFADFKGDELVYDLYTGTGTIAAFIAQSVKKVIGLEYVEDAVQDANENMQLNGVDNAEFYAGDMVKLLTPEFISKHGKPDVVLTDPPRAGMHDKVVKQILNIEPEKIVYISCNPATQARDIALLDEKYKIVKVQPVDMFPQTHHVENVVLLVNRKSQSPNPK